MQGLQKCWRVQAEKQDWQGEALWRFLHFFLTTPDAVIQAVEQCQPISVVKSLHKKEGFKVGFKRR